MKDTSAKLMFVPRVPRGNNKKCRVCGDDEILGSLTKAGLMSNWLPASEFGGVSESIQELTSYFSQGNDMSQG